MAKDQASDAVSTRSARTMLPSEVVAVSEDEEEDEQAWALRLERGLLPGGGMTLSASSPSGRRRLLLQRLLLASAAAAALLALAAVASVGYAAYRAPRGAGEALGAIGARFGVASGRASASLGGPLDAGAIVAKEDNQTLLQLESPRSSLVSGEDYDHQVSSAAWQEWPADWTQSQKAMANRLLGRWTGGLEPGWNTFTFAYNKTVNALQTWDGVYQWGVVELYPVGDTFQGTLVFRNNKSVAVPKRTFRWKFQGCKLRKTWVLDGPDETEYGPLWYKRCWGGRCKCRGVSRC